MFAYYAIKVGHYYITQDGELTWRPFDRRIAFFLRDFYSCDTRILPADQEIKSLCEKAGYRLRECTLYRLECPADSGIREPECAFCKNKQACSVWYCKLKFASK